MEPVVVHRSRAYPADVGRAFDLVLPTPLPELFCRRYGPIPRIREVVDQDGAWGTVGQTRTIVLADGGRMRETLTSVERPSGFGYRIDVERGPLRALVAGAEGHWGFAPAGTGVRITWSWTITPRSRAATRAMPVLAHFWHGYADRALEQVEALLVPPTA